MWKLPENCYELEIIIMRRDFQMTDHDKQVAIKLKKRLSTVVQLLDFRIFGSRARGDADEYSDMDVFIEVEENDEKLTSEIRQVIWEVGFEHSLYISPLIFTRHEIEETPLRSSPIVKNIAKEGVRV